MPLTEAELLSICHAEPSNPSREAGLTLRRYQPNKKGGNSKLEHFFGERPPIDAAVGSGGPKLSLSIPPAENQDHRGATSGPSSASSGGANSPLPPVRTAEQKRMARASTVSVMSGLGILPPGVAEPPASPSKGPSAPQRSSPQRKLRNFFGHRPPSELITSHLPEFFPNTEKRALERTARNSVYMNRDSIARASWLSSVHESMRSDSPRTSLESSPRSRKSSRRRTQRPVPIRQETGDVPRVSLSTDGGRSIDLSSETDDDDVSLQKEPSTPHVLPPVAFSNESLSDSLLPVLTHRNPSPNSRRSSVYTEIKGKVPPSESTALLTLDEITAEVESRRTTPLGDATADGTTASTGDVQASVTVHGGEDAREDNEATLNDDDEDEEDEDEEAEEGGEEYEEDDSQVVEVPEDVTEDDATPDDITPGKLRENGIKIRYLTDYTEKVEIKWSKGALIGSGSFGSVYLGLDMSRGLLMAVKQVELPTGSSVNEERKKNMLNALEREIALLKELQHPNIVQYLGRRNVFRYSSKVAEP